MKKPINNTVWTAVITPLTANGKIDTQSFYTLLKRQEEAGNGILILGSTGEGFNLPEEDKKRILDFTMSQNLKVPIMVLIEGHLLHKQIEWMQTCQKYPIDCFNLVNPIYSRPGTQGVIRWFNALMDASKIPCLLYNHPGRTATTLNPEALKVLSKHPRFWAIKDCGQIADFKALKQAAPNAFFYSGNDNLIGELAPLGAQGLIAVMSNIWPKATREYVRLALKGDKNAHYALALEAAEWVGISNPLPAKYLAYKNGLTQTPECLAPLSMDDLKNERELLACNQKMNEWEQSLIEIAP